MGEKRGKIGEQSIGDRIEALGKTKLEATGAELAKELGVSYETLRKWKRGKSAPSGPRQKTIAERLGVAASVFMFGAEGPSGEPLTKEEARLLSAYRQLLDDDKAKFLKDMEARAREIEELSIRIVRERSPFKSVTTKRPGARA